MLPSFDLIPWSLVQELFASSAPDQTPQQREIYNITTGLFRLMPMGVSKTTNFNLPLSGRPNSDNLPLNRRFGQIYNEQGNPLKVNYIANGQPVPSKNFDSPNLSKHVAFNSPIVNESVEFGIFYRTTSGADQRVTDTADLRILNIPQNDDTFDSRVYVYDFYGLEINDPNRGPYFRTDLITRDLTKPAPFNNIFRDSQNNVEYYSKTLYDIFGNRVFGLQENNATVIRENLLPLILDRFNRPVKSPIKTIGRLQGF